MPVLRPVGLRPVGLRPIGRVRGLRPVGIAALLSLGLVLAGCSSDATGDAAPAPTTSPSATPDPSAAGAGVAAAARARAAREVLVVRRAGRLLHRRTAGARRPTPANGCLRSSHNYPGAGGGRAASAPTSSTSAAAAPTPPRWSACSRPASGPKPPQFDALSRRTDLVTIGIGGNDSNLFGDAGRHLLAAARPRPGRLAVPRPADGRDRRPDRHRAARHPRPRARRRRRHPGPRAATPRVVVVGYPQIVPASGTCPELPLAAGDYAYARRINKGLADAVRLGARGRRRLRRRLRRQRRARHLLRRPVDQRRPDRPLPRPGLPPVRRGAAGRREAGPAGPLRPTLRGASGRPRPRRW